jgi:glycosyltransferase involved in cell wall biosynthesis
MCGTGPERERIENIEGIEDRGFVQPADLPEVMAEAGVFVLPSLYEPWGVAVAEAAMAGLPVICSEACGAGVDLVQPYYTGIKVATGDEPALTAAMHWMHEHESQLHHMGQGGMQLAAAYSATAWAKRWHEYLTELAP